MSKYTTTLPTVVFETQATVADVKKFDFVAVSYRTEKSTLFAVCFEVKTIKELEAHATHCGLFLLQNGIDCLPTDMSLQGCEFNFADGKNGDYSPPHIQHQSLN